MYFPSHKSIFYILFVNISFFPLIDISQTCKISVTTCCCLGCSFFSNSAACWLFFSSLCVLFHSLLLSVFQFLPKPRQLSFKCFSYLKIVAYYFLDSHSIHIYTWYYVKLGSQMCNEVGFTTGRFRHSRNWNFCNLRGKAQWLDNRMMDVTCRTAIWEQWRFWAAQRLQAQLVYQTFTVC